MGDWQVQMFVCTVIGSFTGLMWPLLVAIWKKEIAHVYDALGLPLPGAAEPLPSAERPNLAASILRLFVLPFIRLGLRVLTVAVLGIVISLIAAALSFAAFLHDDTVQTTLKTLGLVGYFAAFNYGFSSAAMIGEFLKGGVMRPPQLPADPEVAQK